MMRKIILWLADGVWYVGLLALAFGLRANAATWYVDNAAAGANNGTSWANAWTAFSSVVWGGGGVVAGDTLYISGGSPSKTYTSGMTVGASGTAGNPITIALDESNASHNGTVLLNNASITLARNYVTINGHVAGASHLVISNVYNSNTTNRMNYWAIANYSSPTTNVQIHYVTVAKCNNGIQQISSRGFQIGHCLFTNIMGDAAICVTASSGGWDTSLIYSNRFFIPGWGADRIQCGSGTSIFGNYFTSSTNPGGVVSGQHPDSVQLAGNYIKVYGNDFVDQGDSDIDMGWSYVSGNYSHLWIFNNVFRITSARSSYHSDVYPDFIRFYGDSPPSGGKVTTMTDVLIANNTFADDTFDWDAICFKDYNAGNPTASVTIKNNIFYNMGKSYSYRTILAQSSSGFTNGSFALNGNVYYYPGANGSYLGVAAAITNASRWITLNGESASKTNSVGFVSYTAFAPGNDFHLASGDTTAKNAGVDLSAYFTTDKDGVTRSGNWDIGAYEYTGGGGGGGGGGATNSGASIVAETVRIGR